MSRWRGSRADALDQSDGRPPDGRRSAAGGVIPRQIAHGDWSPEALALSTSMSLVRIGSELWRLGHRLMTRITMKASMVQLKAPPFTSAAMRAPAPKSQNIWSAFRSILKPARIRLPAPYGWTVPKHTGW